MKIDRFNDAICGCCGRAAVGYGWHPGADKKPIWTCDSPECLQVARETYSLPQDKFTRIEALAAAKAAEAMGQRLDEMGLGKAFESPGFEWEHWLDAMRAGIAAYRKGLVELVKGEAPF